MIIGSNSGYTLTLMLHQGELDFIVESISYNQARDPNNVYELLKREILKMEAMQKIDEQYKINKKKPGADCQ